MNNLKLLLAMMFLTQSLTGQNISITFTGAGAANRIDSVNATNLTTNESVTLPGNETLVLSPYTGIPSVSELAKLTIVYPNPFADKATLTTIVKNPQMVYLNVQNLVGQVVAQTKAFVQSGENDFSLSVNSAGIYLVTLTNNHESASYKIICTESTSANNSIQYLSTVSSNHQNPSQSDLKSSKISYTLGYGKDDIILYRCMSGIYTTIVTDSPTASNNYDMDFIGCTDPEGKNYSIVKIGTQTWMAENLGFLPSVSPSLNEADTARTYWVYGYEGNDINDAKTTNNYNTYGVLYNWKAAMNGTSGSQENPNEVQGICPNGWHLPSDKEWTVLTDNLGVSAAGKMKETGTMHWLSPNEGATNASGFAALPGGGRNITGIFQRLGDLTYFWTSSAYGVSYAWTRKLDFNSDVTRKYFRTNAGFSVRCLHGQGSPGLAIVTLTEIKAITETSASIDCLVYTGGPAITARGVCWNSIGKPNINDDTFNQGSGAGSFSGTITGLTASTLYYMRAYATTIVGTTYSEERWFYTTGGGGTFDFDDQTYSYQTIGRQIWMTENLAYLPSVSPSSVGSQTDPYYYVYNYEGTNTSAAKATVNHSTYGVLYNWAAAKTACPTGWHLPDDEEWKILEKFLQMNQQEADSVGWRNSGTVGGKLKEAGTSHWYSPNTGANNLSRFIALPAGYRDPGGGFGSLGMFTEFWSSTEQGAYVWGRNLFFLFSGIWRSSDTNKSFGLSVRCVKN